MPVAWNLAARVLLDSICLLLLAMLRGRGRLRLRFLGRGLLASCPAYLLHVLCPHLPSILPGLLGLVCASVAAFPFCGFHTAVLNMVFLLLSSCLLGGAFSLLLPLLPSGLWALPIGCMLAFFLSLFVRSRKMPEAFCLQVTVQFRGAEVTLPAMLDTGNLLTDAVTGLPVVVAAGAPLLPLLPIHPDASRPDLLPFGFRLLPVKTCAGSGLLLCFHPSGLVLHVDGQRRITDALVAIAPDTYRGTRALVPSALLNP